MLDPIETKLTDRYKKLSEYDNHLERLNELIDWKIFLPLIDKAFKRERKSTAGRNPYNKLKDNEKNTSNKTWADSAYYSEQMEKLLEELGFASRVIRRHKNHYPEWSEQGRENARRSKIRKRVEHVFGFMTNSMNQMIIRTIGLTRVKTKICLMNLVYNFCRFEQIERLGIA